VYEKLPLGAGGSGDEGRTWQPYSDSLVQAAIMALPWGGPELLGGGSGEHKHHRMSAG
jgi:hypothetical protein